MEENAAPSTSGFVQPQRRNRRQQNRARRTNQRALSRSRTRRRSRTPRQIFVIPRPRSLSREQCQRIARPSREEIQAAVECPICLDNLSESQETRRLICNHVFHEACLFPWVQGDIGNCPVCRRTLINVY